MPSSLPLTAPPPSPPHGHEHISLSGTEFSMSCHVLEGRVPSVDLHPQVPTTEPSTSQSVLRVAVGGDTDNHLASYQQLLFTESRSGTVYTSLPRPPE